MTTLLRFSALLLSLFTCTSLVFGCADDEGHHNGNGNVGPAPDIGIGPTISGGSSGTNAALCDSAEPNDSASRATILANDPIVSSICEGDEDWFRFETVRSGPILLNLIFQHDEGDLDIILYDEDLQELIRAESSDDNEQVEVPNTQPGIYYVKVYAYELAVASYILEVERSSPQDCIEDSLEPNNEPTQATPLSVGDTRAASLCKGDLDIFEIVPQPHVPLQIQVDFQHNLGNLELALFDASGTRLVSSASASDNEEIRFVPLNNAPLYIHVFGYEDASTSYIIRSAQSSELTPLNGLEVLTGRVRFEDPVFNLELGTQTFVWATLPNLHVELRSDDNDALLAETSTDSEGMFEMEYQGEGHSAVYVRAIANGDIDDVRVRVVTSRRESYAVRSAQTVIPGVDNPARIDLDIPSMENVAAPFNVFSATQEGLTTWFQIAPPIRPLAPLDLVWEDRRQFACGTCYRHNDSPPTIYLYGLVDDNDALDDPVVLHEVGHFIQSHYSRDDSPGGAHDGTPTDPLLAWAEGWATFFSCFVRGDDRYYDTLGGWYSLHELEDPDPDYGTFTGQRNTDFISEYFVASTLWDLHDDTSSEDPVFLPSDNFVPDLAALAEQTNIVHGVVGLDFMDYLHTAVCTEPEALNPMIQLLESREFPHELVRASQTCPKTRPPLSWVREKDTGSQERLGVRTHRPLDELTLWMCSPSQVCAPIDSAENLSAQSVLWFPSYEEVVSKSIQGYSWSARARRGSSLWSLPQQPTQLNARKSSPNPVFQGSQVTTARGDRVVEALVDAEP